MILDKVDRTLPRSIFPDGKTETPEDAAAWQHVYGHVCIAGNQWEPLLCDAITEAWGVNPIKHGSYVETATKLVTTAHESETLDADDWGHYGHHTGLNSAY